PLALVYGQENAHNYFLQLCAELGIVGLITFGWTIAAALAPLVSVVRRAAADPIPLGLLAGLGAFLITCASGHPLLVPEAAVRFWMALGRAAAAGPSSERAAAGRHHLRRGDWLIAAACAAIVISVPWRPEVPRVRLSMADDGFGAPAVVGGRRL